MAVALDKRDLPGIARSLGESGKPAPGWVTSDPALDAAYREAAGLPASTPAPAPSSTRTPAKKTPARRSTRSPAPAPTSTPRPPSPQKSTQPATRARAGRTFHVPGVAGDAGGLMLAVFAYPLVLAILQKGPAGATAWLKAKFLNNGTATRSGDQGVNRVGTQQDPNAHLPSLPAPPGTGRLPNGQKIPGTPPDLPPGGANV